MSDDKVLKYRPDIDGLRAIAVLSVVLYHYGIGGLDGGFIGVDIFFVISGYLITNIIHREVEAERFSFSSFYERRARRIFPALFAMLMATLVVGMWLLLPGDLVKLGGSAVATLLFSSNILFWRQSGYFDTASDYNPLLHTWSLAVEEQFYIFLPFLLILLRRHSKERLRLALLTCSIASFVLCLWMQSVRPSATFFLLPFRAWELLLGGWVAIGGLPAIRDGRLRAICSLLALSLLIWSLAWVEAGPQFPGWQAALPVLATVLLLHAGANGTSIVQRLLSLGAIAFLGLISYSLYLLHWPLMVFIRYARAMEPLSPGESWLLLAAALLLASGSYRWIETPFRRKKAVAATTGGARWIGAATGAALILATAAVLVTFNRGWQERFSPDVVSLDEARRPVIPFRECDGSPPGLGSASCRLGSEDVEPSVLVWGDSHALAWAPGLHSVLKEQGVAGLLAVKSACPPLIDVQNPFDKKCYPYNQQLIAGLGSVRFNVVILIASWTSYSSPAGDYELVDEYGRSGNLSVFPSALDRTLTKLQAMADRIVVIGPTPGAPADIPFVLASARRWELSDPSPKLTSTASAESGWFWAAIERREPHLNLIVVDPTGWFCDQESCQYLSDGGELLYRDGGHLSLAGARFAAEMFPSEVLNVEKGPKFSPGAGRLSNER